MDKEDSQGTPQSPEVHEQYVRKELHQGQVTHQGDRREAERVVERDTTTSGHLGALEDEVVPVIPPMSGPADLIGEENQNAQGNEPPGSHSEEDEEELFDPHDMITPG